MNSQTLTHIRDSKGIVRALEQSMFELRVISGPDRGREINSDVTRLVIGSSPHANFTLNDPTVSALHCEIYADPLGFRLKDLGSKKPMKEVFHLIQVKKD